MKRVVAALVVCGMFFEMPAAAQVSQAALKKVPELEKLTFNVGTWNLEHNVKPFAGMAGGKFKAIDKCDWFSFFVRCQWESTGPGGPSKGVSFLGYDRNAKAYTYRGFESTGDVIDARGQLDGDTWHWTSESKVGDVTTASRVTIKHLSATEYTFTMELSQNGGAFTEVEQSTARKVTATPRTRKP